MLGAARSAGDRASTEVPFDIYASLVDALYGVQRSLFVGSAAATLAAWITAWRTGNWVLLGFGAAIAAVAVARTVDMRAYVRARPGLDTAAAVRTWELRYVVGAAIYVGLLGFWCLACFMISDDPFVRLFSFSVVFAYMIGTPGRNFASDILVKAQIAGALIPMSAAMFVAGGMYIVIFAIVLLPFFLAVKLISDSLRRTLLDAVIANRNVSALADRFDTALNNMPQGLCMFDAERRLVVANRQVTDLLGVPPDFIPNGRTARELVTAGLPGREPAPQIRTFLADLEANLSGSGGLLHVELHPGRTVAFTTQPMERGGSVVIVEDITERRIAEARINYLARFDSLTGLPNRSHFRDELDKVLATMRRTGPLAILFVDLDEFKQVNDTLGHPRGDELLCAVADRLRHLVRATDVVARFGGDEFVVLLSPIRSAADAEDTAGRIVRALSEPYEIEGNEIVIGASVGIAVAPRDGVMADLLIKNADMALYHAKADGRRSWRFFSAEMDVELRARRTLENDLRQAVEDKQLTLHFQPLFNLKTMRITCCEALIRWQHPQRGLISPGEFVAVAEDMGLIVEIGAWVLSEACRECMQWPDGVRVAVNLSPVQFRRDDIAAAVAAALKETGLAADRLEIEITESVLLQDIQIASATLQRLRDMGVRISLDDFGTGYSGLSYLSTFPLHKVKIDQSFVQGLRFGDRSLTLLKGVARLSAALGLVVAVEGVETADQLALIASDDCIDEAQGYLFSVPVPARQVRELLRAGPRSQIRLVGDARRQQSA